MSFFVRSIASIMLVIGLFCVVGCESTKTGNKTTTSVFPWAKTQKEPEKPPRTTMTEVIGLDRVLR